MIPLLVSVVAGGVPSAAYLDYLGAAAWTTVAGAGFGVLLSLPGSIAAGVTQRRIDKAGIGNEGGYGVIALVLAVLTVALSARIAYVLPAALHPEGAAVANLVGEGR